MDDHFYNYHKNLAFKKQLKVISFGIKNKSAMIKLVKIKKIKNKYELSIKVNGSFLNIYSQNDNQNHLYNILATLASINLFADIKKLKKDFF